MPIKRCVSHPCIPNPKNPKPRPRSKVDDSEKPSSSSPANPSLTGGKPTSTSNPHLWSDDEVLILLRCAANFRIKTGAKATSTSAIADFFVSVRPSLPPHITQDQVYNKLRRLHHKHRKAKDHATPFYKLSIQAWGGAGDGDDAKANPPFSPKPPDPLPMPANDSAVPRKRKAPDHSNPHLWSDDQVLILLQGAAKFRIETGAKPTSTSAIADFFNSVRPSLPKHITQDQVYNKLRRLHCKHQKAKDNATPFYKLSVQAWGTGNDKDSPIEHISKDNNDAY